MPGRDVDGGAEPAEQVPRLGVVDQPGRPERADDRAQPEQQRGPELELQRGAPERAPRGGRQLHVGARLHAQQRADEQQEGHGEDLHERSPEAKLTAVKFHA